MFLAAWILESRVDRGQEPLRLRWSEAVLLFLIQIFFYAVSNISFVLSNTPFTTQHTAEIFIIRTLADFAGVGISFFYHLLMRQTQARGEAEHMRQLLEMQYANYRQSEESIAVVNRKYHDLKHQIQFLRSEPDPQKRNAYLDQIEDEIKSFERENKTGNAVLDTILTGKSLYCMKQGITMTSVADGKLLDFMEVMDICNIFGNALENAIESVMRIEDQEKRLIHVTVSQVNDFVMIRIENYYEGDLKLDGEEYISTKGDPLFHGYGIKSIKYTVQRYDGAVYIHTDNNWFDIKIAIPMR
jgi:hypothetical protein